MVLGPMVNRVVLGGCQSLNSGPQPPGQSRIGAEEPQGGALDGAGAANPTGRIERGGILDLATEFALEEFSQESLVQAVLRTLLGLSGSPANEDHILQESGEDLLQQPQGCANLVPVVNIQSRHISPIA